MGNSAFLPPSPFETGLQLLQESMCLEELRSEFAGPRTEDDQNTVSQGLGIRRPLGFSTLRCLGHSSRVLQLVEEISDMETMEGN